MKAEIQYPSVLPYRNRQANYWQSVSAETFVNDFRAAINKKRNPIKYLRVSESGDFKTQGDINKLSFIADLLKGIVKVYVYTARLDLDFSQISDNLVVNCSGFELPNTNSFNIKNKSDFDQLPKGVFKCIGDCNKCNLCNKKHNKTVYVRAH